MTYTPPPWLRDTFTPTSPGRHRRRRTPDTTWALALATAALLIALIALWAAAEVRLALMQVMHQ